MTSFISIQVLRVTWVFIPAFDPNLLGFSWLQLTDCSIWPFSPMYVGCLSCNMIKTLGPSSKSCSTCSTWLQQLSLLISALKLGVTWQAILAFFGQSGALHGSPRFLRTPDSQEALSCLRDGAMLAWLCGVSSTNCWAVPYIETLSLWDIKPARHMDIYMYLYLYISMSVLYVSVNTHGQYTYIFSYTIHECIFLRTPHIHIPCIHARASVYVSTCWQPQPSWHHDFRYRTIERVLCWSLSMVAMVVDTCWFLASIRAVQVVNQQFHLLVEV